MKKILGLIFIIAMFIVIGCFDVDSSTSQDDIKQAQKQAEINKASTCKEVN